MGLEHYCAFYLVALVQEEDLNSEDDLSIDTADFAIVQDEHWREALTDILEGGIEAVV